MPSLLLFSNVQCDEYAIREFQCSDGGSSKNSDKLKFRCIKSVFINGFEAFYAHVYNLRSKDKYYLLSQNRNSPACSDYIAFCMFCFLFLVDLRDFPRTTSILLCVSRFRQQPFIQSASQVEVYVSASVCVCTRVYQRTDSYFTLQIHCE